MDRLSERLQDIIHLMHVNVPWRMMPGYMDLITNHRMNVEIGFEARDLDGIGYPEIKGCAAQLRNKGCKISLHAPFWDLCPGSQDRLIRNVTYFRLQQFFDVVARFEPVQVVCHTGFDPYHHRGHIDSCLDNSVALWEPFVRRAESIGAPLLLENVWEHDAEFILNLLKRIDSDWFGFCLDVGHQNSFSKTSLETWLNSTAKFLKEIHLHDNDGTEDSHLPIGQGNINFMFIFEFLQKRGIRPMLTLEPHREEHLYESLSGMETILSQLAAQPAILLSSISQRITSWP